MDPLIIAYIKHLELGNIDAALVCAHLLNLGV